MKTYDDNTLDTTVDEWRAEMEKLEEGAPGITITELKRKMGWSKHMVQTRIEKLLSAGRCIRGMGKRVDSAGRLIRVPVYQLVKGKKK